MAEATEHLRIVITAQDQASAVIRNVGGEMTSMLGNIVKGAAAGAGFAAVNQIAQTISQGFSAAADAIIGFNASLEQSRIAWTTMLGGAAQAETMLSRLQDFAQATPFSFPEVEQAARRFTAMGIAAGDVIPLMRSVAEAAIAVGGGSDAVNRISLALGQMSTRTRVTAEDMMQLTEVGIPAWKILAEATGQSVAQIQDSVTKGRVSADVMIRAFQGFADVHWKDLLDTQTFQTAMSNIGDASRRLLADAFQPLFKGLEDLAIRFQNFLQSDDVRNLAANVQRAQQAVGAFLDTVSKSEPIMRTFTGALSGLATVLGVQVVIAAARAAAGMALFVATLVAANLPLAALALAAATAGIIIAANWDQIVAGTEQMRTGIVTGLGQLASWIADTFAPAIAGAAKAAWEFFANMALAALNAVAGAWAAFWGQDIGPSGQTAFTSLQEMAREGWGGFVDITTAALKFVLDRWNDFTGVLFALKLNNVPMPPWIDAMAGKFVDATTVANSFGGAVRQIPGIATQAFGGLQQFIGEDLPQAIQRTVDMLQAAGADAGNILQGLLEFLSGKLPDLASAGADAGRTLGTALGNGVISTVKPLLEELARMLAQARAAPVLAALEDTEAVIERDKLLLAIRGLPAEARAQARREIRELTRNVLPGQRLEAFDVGRDVTLTQRLETAANLRNQILQAQLALAGGAGAATPGTVGGGAPVAIAAGGAPTAIAPPPAPPPIQIPLQVNIIENGRVVQTYEELLEANTQAKMPPSVQISAVRRN